MNVRAQLRAKVLLTLMLCCSPACQRSQSERAARAVGGTMRDPAAKPQAEAYKRSATGDEVEGSSFVLRLVPPSPFVPSGTSAQMQVELIAKAPWHVNMEFPITASVAKSEDWAETPLEVSSDKALEHTEARARLGWELKSNKEGQFPVFAEVSFAMCTPQQCTLEKQIVKTLVKVQ